MISWLERFFGKEAANAPLAVSDSDLDRLLDLDIEAAKLAHQNWKIRLEAYLAGSSTEDLRPEHICFDDRCDLGKWLHGPARQRMGRFPGFTALLSEHKMFHYAASNVVSLYQAGQVERAQQMLEGQYTQFSAAVLERLSDLQYLVEREAGRSRRGAKRA